MRKWGAAHRPPRKQTWHIPFGVSEVGGDVVGCALITTVVVARQDSGCRITRARRTFIHIRTKSRARARAVKTQPRVLSSISAARTKKELLRLKSGVTSDFRCIMGHVLQRCVNMAIASHC